MRGFTLIELAIVIVIAAILAAVAIPIYQGIVDDSKWSEGKTAVGSVKNAVDVYLASNTDFSLLKTDAAFAIVTDTVYQVIALEKNLGMGENSLVNLQYFGETDFSIVFDAGAGTPVYNIYVTVTGAGTQPSDQGYAVRGVHKSNATPPVVTWYKSTAASGSSALPGTIVAW